MGLTEFICARSIHSLPPRAASSVSPKGSASAAGDGIAYMVGALSGAREYCGHSPVNRVSVGVPARIRADRSPPAGSRARSSPADRACRFLCGLVRFVKRDGALHFRRRKGVQRLGALSAAGRFPATRPPQNQELLTLKLFGPPGIIFFDREGREIPELRVIGFQSAERFSAVLDRVLSR